MSRGVVPQSQSHNASSQETESSLKGGEPNLASNNTSSSETPDTEENGRDSKNDDVSQHTSNLDTVSVQADREKNAAAESNSTQDAAVNSPDNVAERDPLHPVYSRFRAQRFVQIRHSVIFFLFAVVGTLTLIIVKSLSLPFPHVIHFGLVLLFMGTYFLINMFDFIGLRLRYDYLGDNLYYMGFVYTLGILAFTLYEFDGDVNNVYAVVSSFGIALSSTVLGVIFRVVAHQLKVDPQDIDDAMRSELADVTSRLRASLDTVVRDMTIFGDQTRQAISELRDDMAKDVTDNVQTLIEASNRVLESSNETFRGFSESTARMNEFADKTVASLSGLIGRIEAIEAPSNVIEQKLIPATDQIEKIVASIAALTTHEQGRAQGLKAVTDSMVVAVESLEERVALISGAVTYEELASRLDMAATAITEMAENLNSLRSHMTGLVEAENEAVIALRDEYSQSVEAIREHNQALRDELEEFRTLTSETQSALIDLARALKDAI